MIHAGGQGGARPVPWERLAVGVCNSSTENYHVREDFGGEVRDQAACMRASGKSVER